MNAEERLRNSFVSFEVDDARTEATLCMRDRSRLLFRHRVDERWAKADSTGGVEKTLAEETLAAIAIFRLNARHLEISFQDGSRWELPFRGEWRL